MAIYIAIGLASGKVAWKTAVTTIDDIEAPLTVEGAHFCPGAAAGVLWNGPAYSATNLVYVNSLDWCSTLKMHPNLPAFEEGKQFLGSANNFGVHDERKAGWVTAVDADTGKVRWKCESGAPMISGIVVTSAGLMMTIDLDGKFLVFDASTGKLLHRIATAQAAGGGVITYQAGAKQRIALATGDQGLKGVVVDAAAPRKGAVTDDVSFHRGSDIEAVESRQASGVALTPAAAHLWRKRGGPSNGLRSMGDRKQAGPAEKLKSVWPLS